MTRAILLLSMVVVSVMVTNVIGHTVLVSVDGSRSCVRLAPSNSPITDLGSNNMRCYGKNSPAGSRCSVRAGSSVTLKWQHEANGASNDIIAQSHYGPVSVYLAHAESAGNGAAWFKVYEDGHSGGKWATDRLIANNGNVRFTIPANLKSGNYIVRSEIIALHEGFKDNGAQFYAGCADLTVTGGGSGDCGPKVSIPGNWIASNQDPGVKINIYNGVNNYPIPGPNIATCNGNGGNGGGAPAPAPTPRPGGNNNGGGSSGSASGLQNGKVYYLKPLSNQGLCLDASGSNDGAAVLVYNCQNSNNQKWKLINAGNGWELQEQRSGKALDGWASGEGIQLWSYGGGANQKWSVSGNSAGYVFKNVQSGQVLTAQGNNSGAKAHQANSNNGNNQKWKLVAA